MSKVLNLCQVYESFKQISAFLAMEFNSFFKKESDRIQLENIDIADTNGESLRKSYTVWSFNVA